MCRAMFFGGGHAGGEMGHILVEEGVIEGLHHQIVHQLLQHGKVTDHAGARIDRPPHRDIEQVVVAMAVGAGALAVDLLVLGLGELGAGQPVGGSEVGANREEGFHGVVEQVGPEGGLFVEAQTDQGQMRRQALPDGLEQGFGGGQSAFGPAEIELGPAVVEEAKVELQEVIEFLKYTTKNSSVSE